MTLHYFPSCLRKTELIPSYLLSSSRNSLSLITFIVILTLFSNQSQNTNLDHIFTVPNYIAIHRSSHVVDKFIFWRTSKCVYCRLRHSENLTFAMHCQHAISTLYYIILHPHICKHLNCNLQVGKGVCSLKQRQTCRRQTQLMLLQNKQYITPYLLCLKSSKQNQNGLLCLINRWRDHHVNQAPYTQTCEILSDWCCNIDGRAETRAFNKQQTQQCSCTSS